MTLRSLVVICCLMASIAGLKPPLSRITLRLLRLL